MLDKCVDILLSTYNGERYIEDLLESLLGQTYKSIRLIIRDDGSSDRTISILAGYAERYGEKIKLIEADDNIGSSASFCFLAKLATSPYVMFADQDDVWLPEKVEHSIRALANGVGMVFCDLAVTDENLNVVAPSMHVSGCYPVRYILNKPRYMMFLSCVPGCTMLLTRDALDYVLDKGEFPRGLVHDHWVASLVSLRFLINYCPESLILYRQHGGNQVGSQVVSFKYFYRKLTRWAQETYAYDFLLRTEIARRVGYQTSELSYFMIKAFLNMVRVCLMAARRMRGERSR